MRSFCSRLGSLACGAVLTTIIGSSACSGTATTPGELIVEVTTDLSVPKDIDSVRVQIQSSGVTSFDQTYQVGAGQQELPATIGILAGSNPASTAVVRVVGIKGDNALILREATTTVPRNRVALLRMPLGYLCEGSAVDTAQNGTSAMPTIDPISESTCTQGQTCNEGACVSDAVSSASLPVYSTSQVFGGDAAADAAAGGGVCFNTTTCMASSVPLPISLATCTASLPTGVNAADVNIAIQTSDGQGICGGAAGTSPPCFVPIDESATSGWQLVDGSAIQLPPSICGALAGLKATLVVSASCASKTPSTPTCGPWLTGENAGKVLDGGALRVGDAAKDGSSDATRGDATTDGGRDATLPTPANQLVSLHVGDGGTFDLDAAFVPSNRSYSLSTSVATLGQPVRLAYTAPDGSIVTPHDEAGTVLDGGDPAFLFPLNQRNAQASTSFSLKVGPAGGGDAGVYDFLVTPLQEAYAKATVPMLGAELGTAVALSADGNTLAVGASGASGTPDAGGPIPGAGLVYVYRRTASATWGPPVAVQSSALQSGGAFGTSVALSGDGNTLFVGCPVEGGYSGGVYVYGWNTADGGEWSVVAHVTGAPLSAKAGTTLAASADGTMFATGAPGANGVYLSTFTTSWSTLTALPLGSIQPISGALFGGALGMSSDGKTIAVGQGTEEGFPAAYVFTESGTTWTGYTINPPPPGTSMTFGSSVAVSGDGLRATVGDTGFDEVYTYQVTTTGPLLIGSANLVPANDPNPTAGPLLFSSSMALSSDGSTLVVGASNEMSVATGINGSEDAGNSALAKGAVYVYAYAAGSSTWTQTAYVKASNTQSQTNLYFGSAVAFSTDGTTLAVGATGDGSGAAGIPSVDAGPDAGQNNTGSNTASAGAVYVFR